MRIIAKEAAFYHGRLIRKGALVELPEGTKVQKWMRVLAHGESGIPVPEPMKLLSPGEVFRKPPESGSETGVATSTKRSKGEKVIKPEEAEPPFVVGAPSQPTDAKPRKEPK